MLSTPLSFTVLGAVPARTIQHCTTLLYTPFDCYDSAIDYTCPVAKYTIVLYGVAMQTMRFKRDVKRTTN